MRCLRRISGIMGSMDPGDTKQCSKCKEVKSVEAFYSAAGSKDGKRSGCKWCTAASQKSTYNKYREDRLQRAKDWRGANPLQMKAANERWRSENPDYHLTVYKKNAEREKAKTKAWRECNPEYGHSWKTANPDKVRAYKARRRAAQAYPKWLDEQSIAELEAMYSNCPSGHHVDHIVPLLGRDVSGLHVPWNLQYLPAVENLRKSNKLYMENS